jgi:hypothetical protein
VQELDAPELAAARLALEDRLVEQRLLGLWLLDLVPADGGHSRTIANTCTMRNRPQNVCR